jgi:hypothetical protein
MASPFASMARTMGKALSPIFFDAVLTRPGVPTGPAYDPTPGAPTTFKCKALYEEYSAGARGQNLVGEKDVKVMILAASLATEPSSMDIIEIQAQSIKGCIAAPGSGAVLPVQTDPARAVWTCRAVR